jgi:hypothetical protein
MYLHNKMERMAYGNYVTQDDQLYELSKNKIEMEKIKNGFRSFSLRTSIHAP